jgi:hypothetical protein
VLAICAGLLMFYLGVLSGQREIDGYRARQEVALAGVELQSLRTRNLELQSELNGALQEPEIERVARNELGLVRPGDQTVVLIWPLDGLPVTAAAAPKSRPAVPAWRQWVRLFFDVS